MTEEQELDTKDIKLIRVVDEFCDALVEAGYDKEKIIYTLVAFIKDKTYDKFFTDVARTLEGFDGNAIKNDKNRTV